VVGTMNYVSPELAVAFLAADHTPAAFACPPTDCWALGAICYEIIEGHPPYAKPENREDKLARIASPLESHHIQYPDASFAHISEAGLTFLKRLLTRVPEERASAQGALELRWLLPIADKAVRERMAEAPNEANASRPGLGGKRRLQDAIRRLILANRLIARPQEKLEPSERVSATSFAASFTRPSRSPAAGSRMSDMAASFTRPSRSPAAGGMSSKSFQGIERTPKQASGASSVLGLAHRGSSDAGSFRTASFKIRTVETSNMDLPDSLEATPVVEIDLNVDPILYYAQVHSPERSPSRSGSQHGGTRARWSADTFEQELSA